MTAREASGQGASLIAVLTTLVHHFVLYILGIDGNKLQVYDW
ncbi:MAG: hypothetical protein AAGA16_03715 [Cyanobacteria bacterium P01_E01_bin.35]